MLVCMMSYTLRSSEGSNNSPLSADTIVGSPFELND